MLRLRYSLLSVFLCFGLYLAGAVFAQGAAEQQGPIISEITFVGLQHVPADAQQRVHALLKSKVGQPFSNDTAMADSDAIRDQGWFQRVRFDTEPVDTRVHLIFTVVENPLVSGIQFVGNSKFSTAELLKVMQSRGDQVLNRNTVESDGMAIETLYTQKGYIQTRVQDYYVDEETNKLTFVIFEPRVGEIRIDGNTKTREYVIRRQLTFHPGDVYNINDIPAVTAQSATPRPLR